MRDRVAGFQVMEDAAAACHLISPMESDYRGAAKEQSGP
jgi:hypothetical protein